MKYALVTGGSRGLGRAVCCRLAQDGLPVIINYQSNQEAAEETQQFIRQAGGTAELLPFDTADPAAIEQALEAWEEQHPDDYISVLVNNAGIRRDNLLVFMQNEQWHDVLNTSLNGFFYITRRLLKNMMANRCGRIVNMTSLSGIKGLPGQVNYSAAKAALIGATKALAQEVASRKVTVNAVAPGFIATDMTKDLDESTLKKMIPMGRFGSADEVAALVKFLVSDEASYITGEVISINGGLYT
jgi:3-oxoacyl-[acyl-carrier protein] reductase